jgi:hypothetical protein
VGQFIVMRESSPWRSCPAQYAPQAPSRLNIAVVLAELAQVLYTILESTSHIIFGSLEFALAAQITAPGHFALPSVLAQEQTGKRLSKFKHPQATRQRNSKYGGK